MKANVITTILLFIFCVPVAYADLIPILPIGGSVDYEYDGIPYHWTHVFVRHVPLWDIPIVGDNVLVQNIWLPALFYADTVHIIESATWALSPPQGLVVGWLRGYYTDGSYDSMDFVLGVNIAEWSYERPENQPMPYNMPPPAWSEWTNEASDYWYQAHRWYAGLDTDPTKQLEYLQLILAEESYTGREGPLNPLFGIGIGAVTIEGKPVPEPSTILLLTIGLGGMVAYGFRRRKKAQI